MSLTSARRLAVIAAAFLMTVRVVGALGADTPGEYLTAVQRNSQLGISLYLHDVAAARASDELMDRRIFKKDKRIQGWITDVAEKLDGIIVTFVGEDGGAAKALYRVTIPFGDGKVEYQALKPAQPLTESQRARVAARALAIAEFQKREERCAESYNTVVLPIQKPGDPFILVYLLAATDKPNVVMAGGHLRYEVSPDGAHLEGERTFTKACGEFPIGKSNDGAKPEAMMLTHLLDPTPTEIHSFLSRLHHQQIFVGTTENQLVWLVTEGNIIYLQKLDE